jgi:hypothetical protein
LSSSCLAYDGDSLRFWLVNFSHFGCLSLVRDMP